MATRTGYWVTLISAIWLHSVFCRTHPLNVRHVETRAAVVVVAGLRAAPVDGMIPILSPEAVTTNMGQDACPPSLWFDCSYTELQFSMSTSI